MPNLLELSIKIQVVAGIIKKINESRESTIAFNETKNRWTSFYSYQPDNMVMDNIGIITFKNGQLYLHEKNVLYNNFYGEQYSSEIHIVSNTNPSVVKTYLALTEESEDEWEMYQCLTPSGQDSEILITDFEKKEDIFYSNFYRDKNTVNCINALIEGEILKGKTMLIKLRNKLTTETKLFAVDVNWSYSARSNR